MGIDVKFVRVEPEEFQALLDGRMEPSALKASPRSLPRNRDGQIDTSVRLAYKYAQGDWQSVAIEATQEKLSEDDLKDHVKKCRLHFWIDTSRKWNELHMLLTGEYAHDRLKLKTESEDLLSTAIIAGRMLEDNSPCFGSFGHSYLTCQQVQELSARLESLTYESLSAKNEMNKDDSIRELFDRFKAFFQDAAKGNQAIIRETG